MRYRGDDERWKAVADSDPAADGHFVYAVATTGVFCRPSCRSRRPNRKNVRFFGTPTEALDAGFRPCKSCRPADPDAAGPHEALVARACQLIEEAPESPSLEELAGALAMSASNLRRVFRTHTGLTPHGYAKAVRARRLRELLGDAAAGDISQAAYAAGFGSATRFYSTTRETLGMTPSAYRSGGRGETVRFAVAECYLGWVVVAGTGRGLCAVEFGETPEGLRQAVRERFPKATLVEDDPGFASAVAEAVAFIEEPERGCGLPLDVRGTAFQRLVWEALREIPAGSTRSYSEVAERIGRPAAVRAVARACAANPVAVVVPCHRVVRSDGDVSGYRWGVERKRAILARESGREKQRGGSEEPPLDDSNR